MLKSNNVVEEITELELPDLPVGDGATPPTAAKMLELRCHAPVSLIDRISLIKPCFELKRDAHEQARWVFNVLFAARWYVRTFMERGLISVTSGSDDDGVFYCWWGTHWSRVHADDIAHDLVWLLGETHFLKDLLKQVRIDARRDRSDLDARRNAIFLRGQVIELHGSSLSCRSPEKEDLNTWFIDVEYDPQNTACPLWQKFLAEMLPDPKERELLQEIFGYCLLRALEYQVFFIFPGPPGSGKSATLDVLNYLLGGSYDEMRGKVISPFVTSKSLDALGERFGTAGLEHSLVNISSESTYLTDAAESMIKRLTGGDALTIEYKCKDAFTTAANPRMIVVTNEVPTFKDRTDAVHQRCVILPFDHQVELAKAKSNLAHDIFTRERSSIFNWALDGLLRLLGNPGMRRMKFSQPDSSLRALDEHRRESNPAVDWVEHRLEFNESSFVQKQAAYEDFIKFCDATGYAKNLSLRQMNRFTKAVNAELRRRDLKVGDDDRVRLRNSNRVRCFRGVKLVPTSEHTDGNGILPSSTGEIDTKTTAEGVG